MSGQSSKLEGFIFGDLIVTAVLAVLAYGTVEPWSLALFELNALLLAVLLAIHFTFDPQVGWRQWRIAMPLMALVIVAALQCLPLKSASQFDPPTLSLDPQATKEATIKLLALVIYFIAALHTLRRIERRKKVLIVLSVFGFAVSLFAILQRLTSNNKMYWVRPVSPYIAFYGPFGNYNHFAGMIELVLPLPLAYLLFSRTNVGQRVLWLLSVVMMAVAVVLSVSRGGMLAVSVELLAMMLLARWGGIQSARSGDWHEQADARSIGINKLTLGAAAAAVLLLVLWIGYEPLVKRFGSLGEGRSEYSVVTRTEYWRGALQMFFDHPITGVGLGAFPAAYPAYGRSSVRNERLEQAHNDYLQLLTDAGLIGALIGIWFLFEIARVFRKRLQGFQQERSLDRALIIGGGIATLGIGVHSFLDFNLQIAANSLLFLIVLALATAPDFAPTQKEKS